MSQDHVLRDLEDLMRNEFFHTSSAGVVSTSKWDFPIRDARSARYNYKPLHSPSNIRLLSIWPGKDDDRLKGSLREVSPSSKPTYEALSYAWGTPETPHILDLHEGFIPITASLHAALRRLRKPKQTHVLWIDAVCINQRDKTEKEQQILLMREIYSAATCVLCWLGEDDAYRNDAAIAIDLIERIGRADFSKLPSTTVGRRFMQEQNLPLELDPQWYSLLRFWQKEWFRRVWIVQEFVAASNVNFVIGPQEIHWRRLTRGLEKICEYAPLEWALRGDGRFRPERDRAMASGAALWMMYSVKFSRSAVDWSMNLIRSFSERDQSSQRELVIGSSMATDPAARKLIAGLRANSELSVDFMDVLGRVPDLMSNVLQTVGFGGSSPEQKFSLPTLLSIFQASMATDPRDKLYGLLGISTENNQAALIPSYHESVEAVFIRYARYFVVEDSQDDGTIRILYFSGRTHHDRNRLDIPSWVPDWSPSTKIQLNSDMHTSRLKFCFHAAGKSRFIARPTENSRRLYTRGTMVGTVDRIVQSPIQGLDTLIDDIRGWCRSIRDFLLRVDDVIANRRTRYGYAATDEDNHDVQWRTLIGNLGPRPLIPDASLRDAYLQTRQVFDGLTADELGSSMLALIEGGNDWFRSFFQKMQLYDLCETDNGIVGLVPQGTQRGDQICILLGGSIPFVLRPVVDAEASAFELVSSCYIHGLMQGEALQCDFWNEQDICLV